MIRRGAVKQISWNYGWGRSNKSRTSLGRDSNADGRSIYVSVAVIFAGLFMVSLAGCGAESTNLATPEGAIVGRGGYWNYSPSAIQSGNLQQIWWCGNGQNPTVPSREVTLSSMNLSTL